MKQNCYFSERVLSKDLEAAINPGCMFSTNLVHWNITVNQNSSRNRSWIKLMQLHCVIALQCKSEQISVVDSTWQIGSIFAEQVIKTHQWIVKIRIYQWLNLADREHFCGASKSWWRRRWLSHLQKNIWIRNSFFSSCVKISPFYTISFKNFHVIIQQHCSSLLQRIILLHWCFEPMYSPLERYVKQWTELYPAGWYLKQW